jgi:hypothetical protein
VAEELALDQLLGNGRAVDLDEAAVLAERLRVDRTGYRNLPRPVLSEDEDASVGGAAMRICFLSSRIEALSPMRTCFDSTRARRYRFSCSSRRCFKALPTAMTVLSRETASLRR